jgi:Tfp pilus assembly protein PilN
MGQIVIIVIVFGLALLILRLFGAWMLRIDELIAEQKKTNSLLIQGFNKVNKNIKQVGGIEETDSEISAETKN